MAVEALNLQSRSYADQSLKRADYYNNTVKNNKRVENLEQVVQSEEKPVGIAEGVSLIAKGAVNKVKNMGKAILEHPARTLVSVGAAGLVVAAAPLIGVSSAAAGAVLALGFAGYAVFETAKDVSETIKDNRDGRYDEVRQDLGEIGGDAVDLALSLPFVPKAANTLKNTVQYAPRAGINTNLINDLKSGEGIYTSFKKADIAINYETIANQMGMEVKPALEFTNLNDVSTSTQIKYGHYDPTKGTVQLDKQYITPGGKPKVDSSTVIAHELTHYQQFCDIARAQGTDGLETLLVEHYKQNLEGCGAKTVTPDADLEAAEETVRNAIKNKKCHKSLNDTDWTAQDNKLFSADLEEFNKASSNKQAVWENNQTYYKALEKKPKYERAVYDNMLNGDRSAFNSELYQRVIDSQGKIAEGSAEAAKAGRYADACLVSKESERLSQMADKLAAKYAESGKDINILNSNEFEKQACYELYKTNAMEAEAFAVQGAYSHADYSANIAAAAIPMLSESEKEINSHSEDMTLKDVHQAKFHRNI